MKLSKFQIFLTNPLYNNLKKSLKNEIANQHGEINKWIRRNKQIEVQQQKTPKKGWELQGNVIEKLIAKQKQEKNGSRSTPE